MPQTARKKKPQRTLTNKKPQAEAREMRSAQKPDSPGRETNGRFACGNPGGPGNPHARFSAGMLAIARQTMTPEKISAVFDAIYVKALTGDMTATKLLLHYTIGKPGDAPHPDHIERDEWDRHQKNAIKAEEMKLALGSLPCSLGNEIVSTALPALTAARANELAAQLRGEEEGMRDEGKKDKRRGRKGEPNRPHGASTSKSTQDQAATAVDPWDVDTVPPLTNRTLEVGKVTGDSRRTTHRQPTTTNSSIHDSRSTIHDSRDPRSTPGKPPVPRR